MRASRGATSVDVAAAGRDRGKEPGGWQATGAGRHVEESVHLSSRSRLLADLAAKLRVLAGSVADIEGQQRILQRDRAMDLDLLEATINERVSAAVLRVWRDQCVLPCSLGAAASADTYYPVGPREQTKRERILDDLLCGPFAEHLRDRQPSHPPSRLALRSCASVDDPTLGVWDMEVDALARDGRHGVQDLDLCTPGTGCFVPPGVPAQSHSLDRSLDTPSRVVAEIRVGVQTGEHTVPVSVGCQTDAITLTDASSQAVESWDHRMAEMVNNAAAGLMVDLDLRARLVALDSVFAVVMAPLQANDFGTEYCAGVGVAPF